MSSSKSYDISFIPYILKGLTFQCQVSGTQNTLALYFFSQNVEFEKYVLVHSGCFKKLP